jgi:hypothetical protein
MDRAFLACPLKEANPASYICYDWTVLAIRQKAKADQCAPHQVAATEAAYNTVLR